jgi:MSHA biogenesis protein MshM
MSFLYLKHFGLERPPFQITPDTDFFFSGSQRGGILTALLHVASLEEGIVTAVAEVGSGKTLLARLLISHLPDSIDSVYLANPSFSRDEIITAISRDLGLESQSVPTEENLARLHRELLRRHALGRRVLLVVDEAHAMPPESLEEVRMLSNIETDKHKLVNIVLFGQPELDALLSDRKLRQVRDRVIHRFELPPLNREEAEAYIDHRLHIAGWRGDRLFAAAAMGVLIKTSAGRARRINLIADKSLLAAYAEGARRVEKRHVKSACCELDTSPTQATGDGIRWQTAAAGFMLGLAFASAVTWLLNNAPVPSEALATVAEVPLKQVEDSTQEPTAILPITAVTANITPPVMPLPSTATVATMPLNEIVTRTEALVANPDWRGFTMQLATLPTMNSLDNYLVSIQPYLDLSSVYAHKRTYNGHDSVAVYLGNYPSDQAAREAMSSLPDALKADQPVIRTWAGIRREPNP